MRKAPPDAVIVATGAVPANLPVRGTDNKNVVQANDVIRGIVPVGHRVVVIGGRHVGMEVAIDLAGQGKNVSLVTRRKVGRDVRKATRLALINMLMELDVRLYPYFDVVEIRDNGVMAVNEGSLFFFKADTVILAVGVLRKMGLWIASAQQSPRCTPSETAWNRGTPWPRSARAPRSAASSEPFSYNRNQEVRQDQPS